MTDEQCNASQKGAYVTPHDPVRLALEPFRRAIHAAEWVHCLGYFSKRLTSRAVTFGRFFL